MFTIIKKELKSYFNSPLAYVLLVVFLGLINFFYFKNIFLSGVATLRPMFGLLPWFLLFFIPALTMGLLSKEKESGTLEILATQSIKSKDIILGKFFGTLIFVTLAILLTLIIPITLSEAGDFGIGILFSQYLGSIFLAAGFTALGLFASSLTKNSIISFILGITFNFIFIIIGFEMVVLGLPSRFGNFLSKLSIFGHYDSIARGVIDLNDLIYFILLIVIFICSSLFLLNTNLISKKSKENKNLSIVLISLIIITLLINVWSGVFRFRVDLTQDKIYSLSSATKKIIQNLDKKIELNFFVSKDIPAQISEQAQDIKDLLYDYEKYGKGNVVLNIFYPDVSEQAKTKSQEFNIPPLQFNVVAQDEFQIKQGWLGLAISTDDNKKEIISYIQTIDNLEYQISSLIWQMTNENKKSVLFLSGHNEKDLYSEMSYLNQELSKQYEVDTLNLVNPDNKLENIPDEAAVLVIAGSTENISDKELNEIKNYLDNNGSALILSKQIEVNPQFLTATSTQSNLNNILLNYNLKFENNLIYDLKSHETVTMGQGSVNYILPYPFWITALGNVDSKILKNQQIIMIPWSNEINIFPPKADQSLAEDNIKINKLFTTTDAGGFQELPTIDINPQQKFISQDLKSRLVAVAVEKNNSRLIAIGNSDLVSDMFVQNFPENLNFVLDSIEWLAQDEILSGIRSKNLNATPLIFKNNSNKNFIKYFNIAGVPVIIILFGAFWLDRRRRISKKEYN